MMFKTLALLGLLGNAAAAHSHLRAEDASAAAEESSMVEHLDLVLEIDGERQLFPLLPGVKCPTGHVCHVRTATPGVTGSISPMMSALKNNMKTSLSATLDWQEFNKEMTTVVSSNDYCTRRNAMAKAAGLAAGLSLAAVSQPAYAASTAEVKMGSDSGQLVFVPAKISICKGDTIKWTNNKGGPHNVVFDEEAIPAGVDQEKISMDEQLGEEGDTYSVALDTAGDYEYYCEPHRGAGMVAKVVVA